MDRPQQCGLNFYMRCCVLDIETSALEAVGAGFMIGAVIKPLHGKTVKQFRYDTFHERPGKERRLLRAVIEELSNYDLVIGHNVLNFDLPYIKSRAVQLGIPYPLQPFVYDTMLAFKRTAYRTVSNFIGKPTASLAHVIDFFDIRITKKYPLYPRAHWKTVWEEGDAKTSAIDNLMAHCVADVLANEAVYWKILPADSLWGIRRTK